MSTETHFTDTEPRRRLRSLRRIIIGAVGSTVLIIGILMIVLPGPSVLVIPLGLAILATEFLWARLLLARLRRMITSRPRSPDSPP